MRSKNRLVRTAIAGAALLATLAAQTPPLVAGSGVGGYVYNHGESRFVDNVYNFIKHFAYDQYYWTESYEFTSAEDSYVDAMNLAYYSGHGNHFYIAMGPGSSSPQAVDLTTAGSYGDGEQRLKFIVFQSCEVIPSVPDLSDWWSAWVPNGIFQGLHQAIGYRTLSYSGNGISDNFGSRAAGGQALWQAWFDAVNDERSWWRGSDYPGYASVVLYPGLDNDTFFSYGPRPPAHHGALRTYYQY
jgi:hypothetical protein